MRQETRAYGGMAPEVIQVVAYLSAKGEYGGPTSVALDQVRELNSIGRATTLLAGWDGMAKVGTEPGVVHLFRARLALRGRIASLHSTPLLGALLLVPSRAVAHVHFGRDLIALPAALVLAARGIPLVLQPHGMVRPDPRRAVRLLDALLTRPLLRRSAAVIVLTEQERTDILAVAGQRVRTVLVTNGVAVDRTAASVSRASQEARPIEVVFIARLHPRKQVMVFAEVAAALLDEGMDLRCRIAGPDAGDLTRLQEFIRAHPRFASRLRYVGPVTREGARELLRSADVYVLPSVGEVYPVTALEAMAEGAALVITSDCPLAAELAHSGSAIVTEPDVEHMAAAVRRLVSDAALRRATAERALQEVKGRYSISFVARRLIEIYEQAGVGDPRSR